MRPSPRAELPLATGAAPESAREVAVRSGNVGPSPAARSAIQDKTLLVEIFNIEAIGLRGGERFLLIPYSRFQTGGWHCCSSQNGYATVPGALQAIETTRISLGYSDSMRSTTFLRRHSGRLKRYPFPASSRSEFTRRRGKGKVEKGPRVCRFSYHSKEWQPSDLFRVGASSSRA